MIHCFFFKFIKITREHSDINFPFPFPIFAVPLPVAEPPGTSTILNQPIEFEPLTSTILVQQIQSQISEDLNEEVSSGEVIVLENKLSCDTKEKESTEENLEITLQKQSNSESGGGDHGGQYVRTVNESKIDEISDTANTSEFSSAPFVEPCETSNTKQTPYKNNNNDDEYINKNIKVAEKEGNDDESKDILEYLVTFSDSAEHLREVATQKESEVSDKPPIPLPTYLWEDLKKAKEQGETYFPFKLSYI